MAVYSPKEMFPKRKLYAQRWVDGLEGEIHRLAAKMAAKLDVMRRARENGRNNLPATADKELDVVQTHILDSFESGADSIAQALWNRLRGALDLIAERVPKRFEPDALIARARFDLREIRDRARDDLVALCHDEREGWRDLKLFKGVNELARSASYPKSRPPMLVLAAIASALLLESFLNGMIFRDVSPSYTLGGIVQALAFSAVNVALGYCALGFAAARYTAHSTPWKRHLGWSGVSMAITLGLLWNLYVAHYREEAGDKYREFLRTGNPEALTGALINAIRHMLGGVWDLPSWQALVLLIIGLLIFFALGVEGYLGWDDVYPGYGAVDRKHKEARRAYERAARSLKDSLSAALSRAAAAASASIEADEIAVKQAREIESEAEQAEGEAHDSINDLALACAAILHDYREANLYVRTTDPPSYFEMFPRLERVLMPEPMIAQKLAEAQEALSRNRDEKRRFDGLLAGLTEEMLAAQEAFLADVVERATFRADHERRQGQSASGAPPFGAAGASVNP